MELSAVMFKILIFMPFCHCDTRDVPIHKEKELQAVRFEVLAVVNMKIRVFSVVALCSLVEFYQHFRGVCCLHHQGKHWQSP
jgi:hypothetical protein